MVENKLIQIPVQSLNAHKHLSTHSSSHLLEIIFKTTSNMKQMTQKHWLHSFETFYQRKCFFCS